MRLTFVETRWFTERLRLRLGDEGYRALQNELEANPAKGSPMPGCGGFRKCRFSDPSRGKGKRGGLRLIYLYIPEAFRIDFVDVYGKDEKDDLTPQQVIARLLPDVLVKGGDWAGDCIVGREEVEAAGGRVVSAPVVPGYSTTEIVRKIRESAVVTGGDS